MGDGIPMERIRNLSIRKSIGLYLAVSLTVSFLAAVAVMKCASYVQERVWWKYVDEDRYFEAVNGEGRDYMVNVPRPAAGEMGKVDYEISEICDFLQTYTVLFLSIGGSFLAVYLFYRQKLAPPLRELSEASRRIGENDLDFAVTYENRDELGRLCHEFERMRQELVQNNRRLWQNIEDERELRAAIAHDIRSPLSVLKGYQEMLLAFLPEGTISTRKAAEMLGEGMKQIDRMDVFIETMRKLSSLEDRALLSWEITAESLQKELQAEIDVLAAGREKTVVLAVEEGAGQEEMPAAGREKAVVLEEEGTAKKARSRDVQDERTAAGRAMWDAQRTGSRAVQGEEAEKTSAPAAFTGDKEVILEVAENLLSNALRYAGETVEITASVTETELSLRVRDDGCGFGEDIGELTKAFHRQNIRDSLKHAGLGMYISRLYCEKHGGRLLLENDERGGASVTAVFCSL